MIHNASLSIRKNRRGVAYATPRLFFRYPLPQAESLGQKYKEKGYFLLPPINFSTMLVNSSGKMNLEDAPAPIDLSASKYCKVIVF